MYTKITIYTCGCTQCVVYYTRKLQNITKYYKTWRTQEMKSLYINDSYKGKCYKWNTDDLLMYLYVDERVIAIPLKYDVSLKETDNRIDIKVCRN